MKLRLVAAGSISAEKTECHEEYARSLGLPSLSGVRAPLAVVGGGPSVLQYEAELQAWPGTIWAINGAWRWCRERGIDATFFSVDPMPGVAVLAQGVRSAVLASCCDPAVFDALRSAEVQVFTIGPRGMPAGPTSASCAPLAALTAGVPEVVFFGCESSYTDGRTHAYMDEFDPCWMTVRVGGELFQTDAELLLQAETLAAAIREFPHLLSERSGGLLGAMICDPDWEAVALSPLIENSLVHLPAEIKHAQSQENAVP